jgi:serine/threonine-protein kinase
MAEILLARQRGFRGLSRPVVIKRLLPHLADQAALVDMFVEEARFASLINHRNVVRIFDVDRDGESFFIAMEFVDGLGLSSLTKRARRDARPLPIDVALEIAAQACDGLHEAHELRDERGEPLGLVHRDISPANLMIDRTGMVKILDFGIAKSRASAIKTRSGTIKGKFPYMSPEQCLGEPLDRRSDLFSLASVLIELVVAKQVFQRSVVPDTVKAITDEPIPAARELEASVPEVVSAIISRAHERRVDARYATAAEMGAALRAAQEELGGRRSPATLVEFLQTECAELLRERAATVAVAFGAAQPTETPGNGVDDEVPTAQEAISSSVPATAGTASGLRGRRWALGGAFVVGAVLFALAGLFVGRFWPPSDHRAAGPALVLVAPPFYDAQRVKAGLQPLADYLERRLERRVDLEVAPSYRRVIEGLRNGDVDLALVSPLLAVQARAIDPRIQLIASKTYEGASSYQAYIVTSVDSPISSAADLRGTRFCYVDDSSTSGYLLPRHYLRGQGLDPDRTFAQVRTSGSHEQVLQDIIEGRCDAGATFQGAMTFSDDMDVATSKIRIVAITGQPPRGGMLRSPQLPPELERAVRRALFDFNPTRDLGRDTLSPVFPIDGFVAARPADFADVEASARAEGLLGGVVTNE